MLAINKRRCALALRDFSFHMEIRAKYLLKKEWSRFFLSGFGEPVNYAALCRNVEAASKFDATLSNYTWNCGIMECRDGKGHRWLEIVLDCYVANKLIRGRHEMAGILSRPSRY